MSTARLSLARRFKTAYPTAHAALLLVAIVMLWRGIWGLLDTFLFPGQPLLSHLSSLGLGALILAMDDFSLHDLRRR